MPLVTVFLDEKRNKNVKRYMLERDITVKCKAIEDILDRIDFEHMNDYCLGDKQDGII